MISRDWLSKHFPMYWPPIVPEPTPESVRGQQLADSEMRLAKLLHQLDELPGLVTIERARIGRLRKELKK